MAVSLAMMLVVGCADDDDAASPAGAAGSAAASTGGSAGVSGASGTGGSGGSVSDPTSAIYPTLRVLLEGGMKSSCGLNDGTCHNTKSAPDLTTFAHFASTFGAACQQSVGNPAVIVDECEREGDHLVFADGTDRVILSVEVDANAPDVVTTVTVKLSGKLGGQGSLTLRRAKLSGVGDELTRGLPGVTFEATPGKNDSLKMSFSGAASGESARWDLRKYPRVDDDVIVGDPNGNGTVGASLGWREVVPGDPAKSYLYRRLLDDKLGSKMPLVTGTWSASATRALWCFIRSQPKGSTPSEALLDDAIKYQGCPDDPDAPDPTLEGFPAVLSLAQNRCSASGCHGTVNPQEGLVLTVDQLLANTVNVASSQEPSRVLIKPGSTADSYLFCKIDPACTTRKHDLMPRGGQLSTDDLARVAKWIESGAKAE